MGTKQGLEDGRVTSQRWSCRGERTSPPAEIYATLADLSTHTTWAGSMHGKRNFGLRSMEAPTDPAVVGTEFRSTGETQWDRSETARS
jgi:hypothetical protein